MRGLKKRTNNCVDKKARVRYTQSSQNKLREETLTRTTEVQVCPVQKNDERPPLNFDT